MPKYYCDYCDVFLTHDSPSVRKSHNIGWKHRSAVREYYAQFLFHPMPMIGIPTPQGQTPVQVPPSSNVPAPILSPVMPPGPNAPPRVFGLPPPGFAPGMPPPGVFPPHAAPNPSDPGQGPYPPPMGAFPPPPGFIPLAAPPGPGQLPPNVQPPLTGLEANPMSS